MSDSKATSSSISTFGEQAKGLAKNPLGIIALFILLVYALAVVSLGITTFGEKGVNSTPIITWFIALFPVVVFIGFVYLVARHHTKLYGPGDYKQEELFEKLAQLHLSSYPSFQEVPPAVPLGRSGTVEALPNESMLLREKHAAYNEDQRTALESREEQDSEPPGSVEKFVNYRNGRYASGQGFQLVHKLRPLPDGQFDLLVYVIPHKGADMSRVHSAQFFNGRFWGNQVFDGIELNGTFAHRTVAYGPFLCVCCLKLEDGTEVFLDRYVDFEMGDVAQIALIASSASQTSVAPRN